MRKIEKADIMRMLAVGIEETEQLIPVPLAMPAPRRKPTFNEKTTMVANWRKYHPGQMMTMGDFDDMITTWRRFNK
jgi:hypothetical protein